MKNLVLNEKELRKKMIDLDIKTIIRLCDYLNVDPHEILIETETTSTED